MSTFLAFSPDLRAIPPNAGVFFLSALKGGQIPWCTRAVGIISSVPSISCQFPKLAENIANSNHMITRYLAKSHKCEQVAICLKFNHITRGDWPVFNVPKSLLPNKGALYTNLISTSKGRYIIGEKSYLVISSLERKILHKL